MTVTDAQVHIWPAETPSRPWAPDGAGYAHRRSFGVAELLAEMDTAGVDRAVLVPPGWEGDRNDYVLGSAAAHPGRLAVMVRLPPAAPLPPAQLDALLEQPAVVGVRLTFTRGAARSWLDDGTADWLWPLLAARRTPLALYAPGSLAAVRRIAERHPQLPVAVDHAGLALGARGADLGAALAAVRTLARLPNVALKASCLPSYADDGYPFRSVHGFVHGLLDAFGPRRVFWGSDLTRLPCTYRQSVHLFTQALGLPEDVVALLTGGALSEWLGWPAR